MGYSCVRTWAWYGLLVVVWASLGVAAAADPRFADDPIVVESVDRSVEAHSGATRAYFQNFIGNVRGNLALSAGLRFDALDWSIGGAFSGEQINVRSELEWTQVLSYQVQLSGQAQVGRHLYGRGHVAYAAIQSGTVRDSDYRGNDRTDLYSCSVSDTNDDQLWDVLAGVGYPFHFSDQRLLIAPLIGYSAHKQNFRITNGTQTINQPVPLDSRLDSTYRALWQGFWVGCDIRYALPAPVNQAAPMEWSLGLIYHFRTDFSAEATWNLREDFRQPKSFEQKADGHGVTIQAEWLLRITRQLKGALLVQFTDWSTDAGTDTLYLANGSTVAMRLNPVSWRSYSVMLGLTYSFF